MNLASLLYPLAALPQRWAGVQLTSLLNGTTENPEQEQETALPPLKSRLSTSPAGSKINK